MHPEDIQTWIALILGIASTTLAIFATWFGWVSHKISTKMLINAQALLSTITNKVDVISQTTNSQLEKVWDHYFSGSFPSSQTNGEDLPDHLLEKLRNQVAEEVSREIETALEGIAGSNLNQDSIRNLTQSVVDHTSAVSDYKVLLRDVHEQIHKLTQNVASFLWKQGSIGSIAKNFTSLRDFIDYGRRRIDRRLFRELEQIADFEEQLRSGTGDLAPVEQLKQKREEILRLNQVLELLTASVESYDEKVERINRQTENS